MEDVAYKRLLRDITVKIERERWLLALAAMKKRTKTGNVQTQENVDTEVGEKVHENFVQF